MPPALEQDVSVLDAPELLAVQALVAQARVEALTEAVLPGLAGLDVVGLGALGLEPLGKLEGDELGAVVASDHLRPAVAGEEPRQNALDGRRGERTARHQGQGDARVLIEHGEHLEALAAMSATKQFPRLEPSLPRIPLG